jgi:hypothetical protein
VPDCHPVGIGGALLAVGLSHRSNQRVGMRLN